MESDKYGQSTEEMSGLFFFKEYLYNAGHFYNLLGKVYKFYVAV